MRALGLQVCGLRTDCRRDFRHEPPLRVREVTILYQSTEAQTHHDWSFPLLPSCPPPPSPNPQGTGKAVLLRGGQTEGLLPSRLPPEHACHRQDISSCEFMVRYTRTTERSEGSWPCGCTQLFLHKSISVTVLSHTVSDASLPSLFQPQKELPRPPHPQSYLAMSF